MTKPPLSVEGWGPPQNPKAGSWRALSSPRLGLSAPGGWHYGPHLAGGEVRGKAKPPTRVAQLASSRARVAPKAAAGKGASSAWGLGVELRAGQRRLLLQGQRVRAQCRRKRDRERQRGRSSQASGRIVPLESGVGEAGRPDVPRAGGTARVRLIPAQHGGAEQPWQMLLAEDPL